jgi:hypothetical protein
MNSGGRRRLVGVALAALVVAASGRAHAVDSEDDKDAKDAAKDADKNAKSDDEAGDKTTSPGGSADAARTVVPEASKASKASEEPQSMPMAPLLAAAPGWRMGFTGFAELDAIWDSTESFSETVLNQTIARPHTYAGDNPRFQITPKDSRFGFKVEAPDFGGFRTWALLEVDFFGVVPSNATQDQSYSYSSIRMRQYYTKLETPFLDLLVGQTNDLYGWGGAGFYPSTPAFLGVMGEVFHRNPQVRLSEAIKTSAVDVEIAVAGVRSPTRDSGVPDIQAGARLTVNGWQGASAQGPRPAKVAPLSVGISGVGRRLSVTDFSSVPGNNQVAYGWGAVADLFLPIIPAHGQDLSNALSVTGEFSRGTGVTDLYLTLTGGVLFPSLPNPHNALPAPVYTPNIDPGIATFDANNKLQTIDWQGLMVNAHYHLPFRAGKMMSISATYSQIRSDNALKLTPSLGQYVTWDKGQYVDATLWWCITPAFQMALSGQTMSQTYGDGTVARNNRGEASWWFFF